MTEVAPSPCMPAFSPEALEAALVAFTPLKMHLGSRAILQPYPGERVLEAFERLRGPLDLARLQGGLFNVWAVAGLRRDEVRVAQARRALWMAEFGGASSRRFLAACLSRCIEDVDWEAELATGYCIDSEVSPIGQSGDRVDLVVETARHVVGVEMKIGATFGPRQLERYLVAVATRARWRQATGHVLLLAPFESPHDRVPLLSWSMLGDLAHDCVDPKRSQRTFADQLIASFGDYVKSF